jgi:hypothetical protein
LSVKNHESVVAVFSIVALNPTKLKALSRRL